LLQSLSRQDFSNDEFPFMTMQEVEIGTLRCRALRVSYAGELGWELHIPMENQLALFKLLLKSGDSFGLTLIGSRALGNLRLEKGYRSWGAEMTTEVTPRAANLERFCSKTKQYIGKDAVDADRGKAPQRMLATLAIDTDKADCWGSEPVLHQGDLIGYVTSGGYGWRIEKSLAVGWIDAEYADIGRRLQVQILGEIHAAEVIADAAYDSSDTKLRS
jgi:dimethylglycine dehydrogenase